MARRKPEDSKKKGIVVVENPIPHHGVPALFIKSPRDTDTILREIGQQMRRILEFRPAISEGLNVLLGELVLAQKAFAEFMREKNLQDCMERLLAQLRTLPVAPKPGFFRFLCCCGNNSHTACIKFVEAACWDIDEHIKKNVHTFIKKNDKDRVHFSVMTEIVSLLSESFPASSDAENSAVRFFTMSLDIFSNLGLEATGVKSEILGPRGVFKNLASQLRVVHTERDAVFFILQARNHIIFLLKNDEQKMQYKSDWRGLSPFGVSEVREFADTYTPNPETLTARASAVGKFITSQYLEKLGCILSPTVLQKLIKNNDIKGNLFKVTQYVVETANTLYRQTEKSREQDQRDEEAFYISVGEIGVPREVLTSTSSDIHDITRTPSRVSLGVSTPDVLADTELPRGTDSPVAFMRQESLRRGSGLKREGSSASSGGESTASGVLRKEMSRVDVEGLTGAEETKVPAR